MSSRRDSAGTTRAERLPGDARVIEDGRMSFEPRDLLVPRPKRLTTLGAFLPLRTSAPVQAPPTEAMPALTRTLVRALERAGAHARATADPQSLEVRLQIDKTLALPPQGYRLHVDTTRALIAARSAAGLFYGAATLAQWIDLHRYASAPAPLRAIEAVAIEDWPDFAARGVLLDVSRDKVPTLATLFALVDLLASWKINELQLYTEHTFAYRGHETVWHAASPITPEEARTLDRYCRERFVDLVPNQNSFGHFHRWLVHEPYRRLAECPEGIEHPFSEAREPFGLCPTDPGTLELLRDLYDQLLPQFGGELFNVGLDETLDLGRCRTREVCAREGREEVYLRFLGQVHELVRARGRRMQFWDDIVIERPELLARLPADAIALEWGYEADHPFDERLERLARAGVPAYVCPGTSSWNSFAGRAANALGNQQHAARSGLAHGAIGYLNTDWGDNGHLQPLPVSYLGFLAGAACSWNAADAPGNSAEIALPLGFHAFADPTAELGYAATELAGAYELAGATPKNGSALFRLVLSFRDPLTHPRYRGMSAGHLQRTDAHVDAALSRLRRSGSERRDRDLIVRELDWAGRAIQLGCAIGAARLQAGPAAALAEVPASERRHLLGRLDPLVSEHEPLWLARNRPGGRADSLSRLERLRQQVSDSGEEPW